MGVVDHDALAQCRGRVNVDTENLTYPHLDKICQVTFALFPQMMPYTIGLYRLIAFEVQDRLEQTVACRVAFINRNKIGARGFD